MQKRYCDLCGEEIRGHYGIIKAREKTNSGKTVHYNAEIFLDDELCKTCYDRIQKAYYNTAQDIRRKAGLKRKGLPECFGQARKRPDEVWINNACKECGDCKHFFPCLKAKDNKG